MLVTPTGQCTLKQQHAQCAQHYTATGTMQQRPCTEGSPNLIISLHDLAPCRERQAAAGPRCPCGSRFAGLEKDVSYRRLARHKLTRRRMPPRHQLLRRQGRSSLSPLGDPPSRAGSFSVTHHFTSCTSTPTPIFWLSRPPSTDAHARIWLQGAAGTPPSLWVIFCVGPMHALLTLLYCNIINLCSMRPPSISMTPELTWDSTWDHPSSNST